MASTAGGVVSSNRSSGKERIVNFSPELLQAPFVLRCAALFIDYMLLLAVPLIWMIVGRWMNDGAPVLPFGPTVWLIIILLWIMNFLMLPLLRGQTLGKMLTGLTILNMDGTSVHLARLMMRNVLGYLITALTLGLGFVFSAVSPAGRTLHDILSGTVVVRGRKKLV
jgi:uncharacterized RDD family membrane protein YckC